MKSLIKSQSDVNGAEWVYCEVCSKGEPLTPEQISMNHRVTTRRKRAGEQFIRAKKCLDCLDF